MSIWQPMTMEEIKKFTSDVAWSLVSSVTPLLIGFLVSPFLARWLGPSSLGLYSLILIIYGMGILIANFGVSAAITKYAAEYRDDEDRLYQIVSSGIITTVIFGIVVGGFLFIFAGPLAAFFDMPELTKLLPILAFAFPLTSLFQSLLGLLNGLRRMRSYALLEALRSSLMFLCIVTLVKLGLGIKGAILGIVFSISGANIFALFFSKNFLQINFQGYRQNLKKLLSFGVQMFGANALNQIENQADIVLIGYFLTAADVGFYSVAIAIAGLFSLIPLSIQRITYPATSEFWSKNNYGALNKMFDKSIKYSTCLLLSLGLGVAFFAKEIIVAIFAEEFVYATLPLYVLLVARVVRGGTVVPIGGAFAGIGRPNLSLKISAICAATNVVLNILFIPRIGILGAAIATTSSLLLSTVISLVFVIKILSVKIDLKWLGYTLGTTFIVLISFFRIKMLINPYLTGGIILCIYVIIIFKVLLTKEDKAIFKSLIFSPISQR